MHKPRLILIWCAIFPAIALSCSLNGAERGSSKRGDSFSENVYLKVGLPEARNLICGLYLFPGALIGGTELHVFPDGTAMIVEFSDISLSRLIATGSWHYEADTLKITWSHLRQRELESSMLPKQKGDIREYIMYSGISNDRKTREYFLAPADTRPVTRTNLISQFVRYHDWQKIKSTYLEQLEK